MEEISIVFFQQDLRLLDHQALYEASQHPYPILLVYIFEETEQKIWFNDLKKRGPYRTAFLIESLLDLNKQLQEYNQSLYIQVGRSVDVFQSLNKTYQIKHFFYHEDDGSEEKQRIDAIKHVLPMTIFHRYKGKTLLHPDDLPFSLANIPLSFTSFRKKVEKQFSIRPLFPKPQTLQPLKTTLPATPVPTLAALGYQQVDMHIKGGEQAALARLHDYFFVLKRASTYKQTRNGLLYFNDSTKFSFYLSHGNVSPRVIYHTLQQYEQTYEKNESTYWVFFELLWRDYFSFLYQTYTTNFFTSSGILQLNIPFQKREEWFLAWMNGETGEPFIDANMKELKQTGYMSNRGRQNVASYFVKNLQLDWRLGAQYFESMLLDYDVTSNYGNWQYIAGIGADPRGFRIFHIHKQQKQYDPTESYIRKWLSAEEIKTYKPIVSLEQSSEMAKKLYQFAKKR